MDGATASQTESRITSSADDLLRHFLRNLDRLTYKAAEAVARERIADDSAVVRIESQDVEKALDVVLGSQYEEHRQQLFGRTGATP